MGLFKKTNTNETKQELKKIPECDENVKISLFNEFGILYLLDMLK